MHTHTPLLPRATLPTAHPNKADNAAHAHCLCCSAPHLLWNTVARLLPSSAQQQAQLHAGKAIPHSMITYLGLSHLRAFTQAPLAFFLTLFPSSIPSLGFLSSTHASLQLLSFSCHLVHIGSLPDHFLQAPRLHSPGIQSSSSFLEILLVPLAGPTMAMLKQPRHTKDSSQPASRSWQSHPFPVPSTPLAEAFFTRFNWTPPAATPQPPTAKSFPADQGIILQLTSSMAPTSVEMRY